MALFSPASRALQIPFDEALLFESDSTGAAVPEPLTVPLYRVQLIREGPSLLTPRFDVTRPEDAAQIFTEYLRDPDREHFALLLLDTRNRLIGLHTVSIGTLDSALVTPREVFKAAFLANAARILAAHNHPSGDPEPSPEDQIVTARLKQAGEILGVELVDHLVLGAHGRFVSFRANGWL